MLVNIKSYTLQVLKNQILSIQYFHYLMYPLLNFNSQLIKQIENVQQ